MPATLRVLSDDAEITVPEDRPVVVGRGKTADLVLDDPQVSRRHLIIEPAGGAWVVRDISTNGTWMNGRRFRRLDVRAEDLDSDVLLRLGGPAGPEVAIVADAGWPSHFDMTTALHNSDDLHVGPRLPPDEPVEREHHNVYRLRRGTTSIGRARDNDIVVGDLLASRSHAELLVGRGGVEVVDLDSANGTFVNGNRINSAAVREGDLIAIGHHVFQLVGDELVEYIDSGDITFEADGLDVFVGETQLLHDMSFRLPGGALLAVIGPSGSGKSTLLNALTGFRPADSGTVRYTGRDMYADYDELRRRIGYVPQDDILHTSLTVREALEYGAELRFPADTTKEERRARVDEVLEELGLTAAAEHFEERRYADDGPFDDGPFDDAPPAGPGHADLADRKVESLSGGQRKRTSVALELLTQPTLLFLDEPTSGLDPGLDKEVMESLRRLADGGRTVIVVTHSVAQLEMCDYVLALAQGGHTAYFGPPQDALPFFNEGDWADVFRMLKTASGSRRSAARFRSSTYSVAASVRAPAARRVPPQMPGIRQQPLFSQVMTLSRRYLRVIASDRTYLRLIIIFPVLLGVIPQLVPAPNGMGPVTKTLTLPDGQAVEQPIPNVEAPQVLLMIVLCACFMGTANSIREIVKERAIYRRERAIGLSKGAYVVSKAGVLTLITTLQGIVFTVIAVAGRAPGQAVVLNSPMLEILLAVVVLSWSSAMTGLLVSAWVDNTDKTMPLLVLVTIAQLVFSGGMIPLEGEQGLQQVSYLFASRWGFAAVASTTDLNLVQRSGEDTPLGTGTVRDPLWNHDASTYLLDIALGVALSLLMVVVTFLLLRRVDPKVARRRNRHADSPS